MAATTITFTVESANQTGDWTILKCWVGNMTDPTTGTHFWYQPPPEPSWTWSNDGNNVQAFGLHFNFNYSVNGGTTQTGTAIGMVVVDPGSLPTDDYSIQVKLVPCCINGSSNNPQLRVEVESGPGTYHAVEYQPACPNC